jgi:hypothetical protein
MTLDDLLKLEKKKSNIEEFFALLYGQEIHPAFLVYSDLPVDFSRIDSLEVWQIENNNDFYFVLYFCNQPFLIFEMDVDAVDIKNVTCINLEIYRNSIIYLSNNLGLRYVPFKDRNSRVT